MHRSFSLLLLGLLIAQPAVAQTSAPFGQRDLAQGLENTFHPPKIYVMDVQVGEATAQKITGTFTVLSSDDYAVGDLKFRTEILGALPNTGIPADITAEEAAQHVLLYDRQLQDNLFALLPGETFTVPFTHTLTTPLPAGEYTLQVQLVTAQGRELGWNTASITLPALKSSFVHVVPGTLSLPEFPDQNLRALSGPNLNPGSEFTLRATAINAGSQPVTVTPTLTTYQFDITRGNGVVTKYPAVTLKAGESKPLDLPVQAEKTPEVYSVYLSLHSATGKPLSSLAEYRYVVRGEDADVMYARLVNLGDAVGEDTYIRLDYVGSADAETKVEGKLALSLEDSAGVFAQLVPVPVQLSDSIQSGTVPLRTTRIPVGEVKVNTQIVGQRGVLTAHVTQFPLSDAQRQALAAKSTFKVRFNHTFGPYVLPLGATIGLFIATGVLARHWSQKRKRRKRK